MKKYDFVLEKINKYISSTLITVIKSDKNDEVEEFIKLKKYYSTKSNKKEISLIDFDGWDRKTGLNKDIVFIYNYSFKDDNDLLIRSIYDDYEDLKIFLICKSCFDYAFVTTHLSGRIELCTLYFDSYRYDDSGYSFNDFLYFLTLSESKKNKLLQVQNEICERYSYRFNKIKYQCLLNLLAENVGHPLSKREISKMVKEDNVFIHKDVLGKIIDELINHNIIIPCTKFDVVRKKNLTTNTYYFFKDIPYLKRLLVRRKIEFPSEKLLLNGVFLEMYFGSSKIDAINNALDDCYLFTINRYNSEMKMISYVYELSAENVEKIAFEMQKLNSLCNKYIISGSSVRKSVTFGVTVENIDDYFEEDKNEL